MIFDRPYPGSTIDQKLYHDKNSYESTRIITALKHQWLLVDTDAIEKETGFSRRLQRRVFRSMSRRKEIGYKRIEDKTWINLATDEFVEIPRPRPGRTFIKGPTEEIDNITNYLWCMTCKTTDDLVKQTVTHNLDGDVQHYMCRDCENKRKAKRMVPESKWRIAHNNWKTNKKRADRLQKELDFLRR